MVAPRVLGQLVPPLPEERSVPTAGQWGRRAARRLRDAFTGAVHDARRILSREEGNAIVEFIGWSAVLVVPVLYLVVTLAQIGRAHV